MSGAIVQSIPTYTIRTGDSVRDRETVLSIWSSTLGKPSRHAAKFEWFYRECPQPGPVFCLLRHEPTATWIGTAAAGQRRMLWKGREIRAGVLVDMAVDPRHRSLGPALLMQDALMHATGRDVALLYGFPNVRSLPVMKRLGYTVYGNMSRYMRVLRHREYLARHMPRFAARGAGALLDLLQSVRGIKHLWRSRSWVASWQDHADPRMDELWRTSEHGDGLLGIRDTALLRWRFDAMPLARTRYLCVGESVGGPLLAWFACQVEAGVLHICDFWSRDASTGVDKAIIEALLRAARHEKHNAVALQYAAPPGKLASWLASGFVERERRPIVFRWLRPTDSQEMVDFHLTAADEDE